MATRTIRTDRVEDLDSKKLAKVIEKIIKEKRRDNHEDDEDDYKIPLKFIFDDLERAEVSCFDNELTEALFILKDKGVIEILFEGFFMRNSDNTDNADDEPEVYIISPTLK